MGPSACFRSPGGAGGLSALGTSPGVRARIAWSGRRFVRVGGVLGAAATLAQDGEAMHTCQHEQYRTQNQAPKTLISECIRAPVPSHGAEPVVLHDLRETVRG